MSKEWTVGQQLQRDLVITRTITKWHQILKRKLDLMQHAITNEVHEVAINVAKMIVEDVKEMAVEVKEAENWQPPGRGRKDDQ